MEMAARERFIALLHGRGVLPPLAPSHVWHPALSREIDALLPPAPSTRTEEASLLFGAALHLWNDNLEAAHQIVQLFEQQPTGCLLHAIVHRREGDFWNSKYWLRQAGAHPCYHSLQARVAPLLAEERASVAASDSRLAACFRTMADQGEWNPYLFVEAAAMQREMAGENESRALLERIQQLELTSVLRYLDGWLRQDGNEGGSA